MSTQRDYKAEYRRRIARGKALGLSRSQARGHPRKGEPLASAQAAKPKSDAKIEFAVLHMNQGASMTAAAKVAGVSPQRLKQFVLAHKIGRIRKRRLVMADRRLRRVPIIKDANTKAITVSGFEVASHLGRYHSAVGRFVVSGELDHITSFVGDGVKDAQGRFHPFETDPNELFRYAAKDEPVFHEIYAIVSN